MEAVERALLEETVREAIVAVPPADRSALDAVLAELGWLEMLDAERRDAIEIVFTALGLANGAASVLDDVVVSALGVAPRPDLAAVLPPYARWDVPGVVTGTDVQAVGLASARAATAAELLVACRSGDGVALVIVPAGAAKVTPVHGADADAGMHQVQLAHAEASPVGLPVERWDDAVAAGRRALGHQTSGASRAMLDLARTHALDREQFGKPIARFQAVRHRLAETLVAIEALDASLGAAWDEGSPLASALAKVVAGRTARTVAVHCQQVLGGIGFTTDHVFHQFLKRTMALEGLFGSADEVVLDIGRRVIAARAVPNLIEL